MPPHRTPAERATAVRAYGTMNTLRALERLATRPHSAPELAASLDIGVRAARRLLQRLELEGYAVQEAGGRRRFRATLRLAVVGRMLTAHAALPRVATTWVARLTAATRCSAHLWIAAGDHLLCIVHASPELADAGHPQPMLRELVLDPDGAAAWVLSHPEQRSCVYAADGARPAAAASVLEAGTVVAALGVTGARRVETIEAVVRASLALSRDLEAQRGRPR